MNGNGCQILLWRNDFDKVSHGESLEELDDGSVAKVPNFHGAVAFGKPLVAALNVLLTRSPHPLPIVFQCTSHRRCHRCRRCRRSRQQLRSDFHEGSALAGQFD